MVVGVSASDVYLYRYSTPALVNIEIGKYRDDLTIAYRPDIGIMYEVSDEKTALTFQKAFFQFPLRQLKVL